MNFAIFGGRMCNKSNGLNIIFLVNELNQLGGVHTFAKNLTICLRSFCDVEAAIIGVKSFARDGDVNYLFDQDGVFRRKLSLERNLEEVKDLLGVTSAKIISLQFYAHLNFQHLLSDKDVVLMFHGDVRDLVAKKKYTWQFDSLNLFSLHNYKKIIVLSERNMHILKSYVNPFIRPKIDYIYNVTNSALRSNCFSSTGEFAFVGRLDSDKNIFNLLEIFGHPCLSSDATLHVYGSGKLASKFWSEVKLRGLEKKIIMKGVTSDFMTIYQNKRGIIITSQSEGMPMIILEAYSYGIPVYCYNSFTAASEIIEDGKTGKLIPNNDINAYVEALSAPLEPDPDAITKKLELFSYDSVAPKWLNLLSDLKLASATGRACFWKIPFFLKMNAVPLILKREIVKLKWRLVHYFF